MMSENNDQGPRIEAGSPAWKKMVYKIKRALGKEELEDIGANIQQAGQQKGSQDNPQPKSS